MSHNLRRLRNAFYRMHRFLEWMKHYSRVNGTWFVSKLLIPLMSHSDGLAGPLVSVRSLDVENGESVNGNEIPGNNRSVIDLE